MTVVRQFRLGRNPSAQLIAYLAQHDAIDALCLRRVGTHGGKQWHAQAIGDAKAIAKIDRRVRNDRISIRDLLGSAMVWPA